MYLNTLLPSFGSKINPKRVGRGIGSGSGKTAGRGHKGQNSRSGGGVRPGFEGGQMPLYRRLPKFGFRSRKFIITQEVRLCNLSDIKNKIIDISVLKSVKILNKKIKFVKIILSGNINRAVTIRGLRVSKGARRAIENAGGKVEI